jgi:integrase
MRSRRVRAFEKGTYRRWDDSDCTRGADLHSVAESRERLLGPRHWFEDAVKKAGLRNSTWHDLRHTFASRLVMADVDIRTVAELMGHKSIQMTMRDAHLAPEHKRVAVERLAGYTS